MNVYSIIEPMVRKSYPVKNVPKKRKESFRVYMKPLAGVKNTFIVSANAFRVRK